MIYNTATLIAAHKKSSYHREEVFNSSICGCFYCLSSFSPTDIEELTDEEQTAFCPKCGIDSVIGDLSGYPVEDPIFLQEMRMHWFNK